MRTEKEGLYVIYDKGAEDITPVFQAKNRNVAIRNFINAILQSPIPDEFELHQVAVMQYKDTIDTVLVTPENKLIVKGDECDELIAKIRAGRTKAEPIF